MTKQALETNLIGRKVRLPNDDDAKEDAQRQYPGPEFDTTVAAATAVRWYHWLGQSKYQPHIGKVGEIVAVYQYEGRSVRLLVQFGNELVETIPDFIRFI
jgi:hypothetical protein